MRPRWKEYLPIGLIIIFSLFLFRDYFVKGLIPFPANLLVSYFEPWKSYPVPEYPNGPPNKAMGFDSLRIFYPLKKVAIDAIKKSQPPLWNPFNASGNVLLATYQSAVFHPLAFLFLALPIIEAWSAITMLQPIISGIFMYLFLGRLMLPKSSRLLGSISYAFSGFFMVWWQESYMFTYAASMLPLALYFVERKMPVAIAISLALSIFSGAFQMSFYVYIFVAVWIVYRKLYWYLLALPLSFLVSAVHLFPNLEAYFYSTRVSTDVKYIFDAYLLPLHQLITLFAPDYFGNPGTYNYFGKGFYHERLMWLGAVPFIFILTQLIRKKTEKHQRFFQISFLITLSLVLSLPTTWLLLYYLKIPLLSTMTPSRMVMLVSFAGSVLAAFGVADYWKGFSKKTLLSISLLFLAIIAGAAGVPLIERYYDDQHTQYLISLRNLVIPTVTVFITMVLLWITRTKAHYRPIGFVLLLFLLLSNIFLFSKKYHYFSERRFVYPETPVLTALKQKAGFDRFWTYDNGYIEKNFASYYGLFSPEGYDSILNRRYAEFLAYSNSRGKSSNPDRANALIQSTDHLGDILSDPYRKKTLELLGVRYIVRKLTPDKNEQTILPDPQELPRIWEDGIYAVHEYKSALPRAYLYTDLQTESNEQTLLADLFDEKTDISKTVFVEEDISLSSPIATGSATIVTYTPNTVKINTHTTGDMLLYLSDAWYPGWNVYVDGNKSKLLRANYAFRAVVVPTGDHTIDFRYEPMSWTLGVAGSVIGLVICLLVALTHPGHFGIVRRN